MPYCSSCGHEVSRGKFCPECGQPTDLSVRPDDTSTPSTVPSEHHDKGAVSFSLSYLFANGWKPFAITALCLAFSWLIIPYFLVYGYAYRLGRSAIRGDPIPSGYDDWIGILTDGVIFFIATLPIQAAILLFSVVPIGVGAMIESIGLIVGGILLYLVLVYLGAGVLPTFLATGSLSETYRGLQFLRIVGTVQHLKAMVLIIILSFLLSILMVFVAIALILTILGILLLPFLFLGVTTVTTLLPFTLFAYYYREAEEAGAVDSVSDEARLASTF